MSTAAKTKKAAKPKAPAAHPKYIDMTKAAISSLKERNGSSRQAILKYIMSNYKVGNDQKSVNSRLKVALRNGIKKGTLKHHGKGTGATGSFKVAEKAKPAKKAVKKPKAAAAKKPKKSPVKKAAKAKSPKKAAAKKPAKAKTPKKAAAPKKAAKPAAKKPAAKKPAKKSPKKAGAKKAAKK